MLSGSANVLRDHWDNIDDGERAELTGALARGAERLRRVVDDLLTTARLETGVLQLRIVDVDIAVVIRDVLADDGVSIGAVDVQLACSDGLVVRADRTRVAQMIRTYLANAVAHGRPPIAVETEGVDGSVEIRVRDHGPGVVPEGVDRLFAKSERLGQAEGTGLGLYLVRALARAHGGDAWYVPGRPGACFVVRLPAAR